MFFISKAYDSTDKHLYRQNDEIQNTLSTVLISRAPYKNNIQQLCRFPHLYLRIKTKNKIKFAFSQAIPTNDLF